MNARMRHLLTGLVAALGLLLMAGGIATDTNGAVVVGLIVAAAGFTAWRRERKA